MVLIQTCTSLSFDTFCVIIFSTRWKSNSIMNLVLLSPAVLNQHIFLCLPQNVSCLCLLSPPIMLTWSPLSPPSAWPGLCRSLSLSASISLWCLHGHYVIHCHWQPCLSSFGLAHGINCFLTITSEGCAQWDNITAHRSVSLWYLYWQPLNQGIDLKLKNKKRSLCSCN